MKKSSICNANGVIDSKKLGLALGLVNRNHGSKSVASPSERTTTQLLPGKDLSMAIEGLKSHADRMKSYSRECYMVFHVLLSSGCRISEVLGIRAVDILANGMCRIHGRKKSEDRIINCGLATDYMLSCKRDNVAPFQNVNRKFVWSVFKKFNIELGVDSSGKKVVTHSLRHIMVASAKGIGVDNNTTGNFIGHKNKSNTARYGNIKK